MNAYHEAVAPALAAYNKAMALARAARDKEATDGR